ncbi:hypothetical protein EON83_20815 [bacterium]|nr:MAG: hypothetical protein EON83_20815 [bacterium]
MDERTELLRFKLAANQQRLFRQEYLAELPERLGTYLEGRPFVHSPQLDDIISLFYISPEGIWRNTDDDDGERFFRPEGYEYRELGWVDQLFDAVFLVGSQHDRKMAYFYPFDGPLYQVPFGWVRRNFADLFRCESRTQNSGLRLRYCPERLGVVTTDLKVGLIIDNYSGYLEEDPNSDEIVYQLATWGI